jgi:hypothetical protein
VTGPTLAQDQANTPSYQVAGMTGTPQEMARLRAATLLPRSRIVCGRGPMKVIPAAAQASANSGLSDRKP